jgi:hypothetical protein
VAVSDPGGDGEAAVPQPHPGAQPEGPHPRPLPAPGTPTFPRLQHSAFITKLHFPHLFGSYLLQVSAEKT